MNQPTTAFAPTRAAPSAPPAATPPALRAVISASRTAIASAAMFSLFLNLLMLVPSIYMLQVYDRVLSTGSVPTLLMLTLITTFLFIIFAIKLAVSCIDISKLDPRFIVSPKVSQT